MEYHIVRVNPDGSEYEYPGKLPHEQACKRANSYRALFTRRYKNLRYEFFVESVLERTLRKVRLTTLSLPIYQVYDGVGRPVEQFGSLQEAQANMGEDYTVAKL